MSEYGLTNGSYQICGECGSAHGAPKSVLGMWRGECAICGQPRSVANAKHDYALSDEEVERIIEERTV